MRHLLLIQVYSLDALNTIHDPHMEACKISSYGRIANHNIGQTQSFASFCETLLHHCTALPFSEKGITGGVLFQIFRKLAIILVYKYFQDNQTLCSIDVEYICTDFIYRKCKIRRSFGGFLVYKCCPEKQIQL